MLYFAYGSLMDLAQLRESCPKAQLRHKSARLDGCELDFRRCSPKRWGGGVADIVSRADASVFGCVWELSRAELAALDRREGVHRESPAYRRLTVTVSIDCQEIEAETYTVVEKSPDPIPPTAEYARLMVDSAGEHGLPLDYQAHLKRLLDRLGVVL